MRGKTERKIAGFLRIALVALTVLAQLALVILLAYYLRGNALWVYVLIEALGMLIIVTLVSRHHNSAFTVAWILIIAMLPVFGQILYLMWGRSDVHGRRPERIRASIEYGELFLKKDPAIYKKFGQEHPDRKRIAGYLGRKGFPLYQGTGCTYYPSGEAQYDAMLAEMEKAGKFIFISTFILDTGVLWDRVRDVLVRKAQQGVEVRLMWDDFGSILTAPDNLLRDMAANGVKAMRYSPVHRFVSRLYINNRNHQKIVVIDGKAAYTGGTNIADEYINAIEKHGHWKDTAIRMEGDAVWSMTVNFLEMWDGETGEHSDYEAYQSNIKVEGEGYFQPFADGPVNNPDNPAEVMYRTMITNAREYVYITTPYLVIEGNMLEALCTAAISGVDVRIITPKKWDHWYVHAVTRSNYKELLKSGVKVYEYTPGFIHAKAVISDDDHAVTGSINMDYRSFNAHFENGVWICGAPVLKDIKQDILDTLAVCEEIDLQAYLKRPLYDRFLGAVLRVFAVLM